MSNIVNCLEVFTIHSLGSGGFRGAIRAIAPPFENHLHKKIYVIGSQVCLIGHVYAMDVIVFHRKLIS
jgi:hypothetical protein